MEGNTLTMEETRSVMVGNLTVDSKPIKDVLEMKGHDEVITEIMRIGKGEVRLSEAGVREIHKGIMYDENEEKKIKIGKWKTEPNHIYNYKTNVLILSCLPKCPQECTTCLTKPMQPLMPLYKTKRMQGILLI